MRTTKLLLAASLWILPAMAAHADTFNLSNVTFQDGTTASGTIDINTSTGIVDAINFHYSGAQNYTITTIDSQGSVPANNAYLIQTDVNHALMFLSLNTGSLVGYTGGNLSSINTPCNGEECYGFFSYISDDVPYFSYIQSGSLTPTAPTPEPSSLLLMASGLVGSGLTLRRRFSPANS